MFDTMPVVHFNPAANFTRSPKVTKPPFPPRPLPSPYPSPYP